MRKLLGTLFALALLLAACSSEPDTTSTTGAEDPAATGGGGDQAFCDQMKLASETEALDVDDAEALAQLQQIVADAPEVIQEEMNVFLDVAEEISEIPEDDLEGLGAAMEAIFSPEVIQAALAIETWGVEECGFDADWFQSDSVDTTLGEPDFGDDFGDDFDLGESDGFNITTLENYLAENNAGAAWVDSINSWSMLGDGEIEVGGDLTADEALDACEAVTTFAYSFNPIATVTVTDNSGEVLAANDGAGGSCQDA